MPKTPVDKPGSSKEVPFEKPQKRKRKRKKDDKHNYKLSSGEDSASDGKKPSGKRIKNASEVEKRLSKNESAKSGKKITLKSLNAINARDKDDNAISKPTKTKSKFKSSQKKKKQKVKNASISTPVRSASEDETEDEDLPLSDDLPNYVDKFGILESKVNRFKRDVTQYNIEFLTIDEVCLEGLDGITLEALWTRISVATEQPLPFSDSIMRYFWHILTSRNDIEFFILKEAREKLVIFDRFENHDPLLGACIEPIEAPLDIYPFSPVKNEGIYGSASSYETRTNVTDQVRNLTLQEVELLYGMRLIMVGSQKLRTKVLTNPIVDPNVELMHPEYLLLERIARSRRSGELTQGKASLQTLNKDPKSLFYNRKLLLQHELVNKQQFYLISSEAHHSACTLLHLNRFYNVRKTKSQIMTEQIVDVLRRRPSNRMDCADARRVFGHPKSLKKLFKFQEFQKLVKIDMCYRLRDLYPNTTAQQWKSRGTDSEKLVRTIELINPSVNVGGSWNDDDQKDDSSDEDTTKEMIFNRPLLYQIYMFINNSGQDGISLREIRNCTGFDYYSVRSAIKTLLSANYICAVKIDYGRQRLMRYLCNYRERITEETPELENEQEALDFVSNVLGIDSSLLSKQPKVTLQQKTTMGKYALIKELRKQSKSESQPILEDIFKNQHEYYTSKNTINFNPDLERLDIFCNESVNNNNKTANKLKYNFNHICRQIKGLNKKEPLEFEGNILCPINLTECSRNYRQLCYFVCKVAMSILVQSRYEIKMLEPRYRYQCKQQLPKEKLMELAQQMPKLIETDEISHEPIGRAGTSYPFIPKKVRYPIYMGPKPEIIYHSIDNNKIEVTVMVSTKPDQYGETNSSYVKDNNATLRTVKRTKFVIDIVRQEKIITDVFSITKLLTNLDIEEGYKVKIDKKSVDRIYMRLVKAGLIKILQVTLQFAGGIRCSTVICDASYELQYTVIESLIEQLKMKAFSTTATNLQIKDCSLNEADLFASNQITSSIGELSLLTNSDPPYKFQRSIGRDYGNAPKFMRMRILHEFMFYLIYDFSSDSQPVAANEGTEMPPIYCSENNWKMFVPPLPSHNGWPQGWTLVCDLLLRLPLSLFVKICNVSFIIPELGELLLDPIKQHTLIKFLPTDVRNALLYKRKYIFTVHETICRLCFIGLVQFGPQKLREKDQVFVYLNRRASLWDTTVSAPGYHYVEDREYKHTKYHFKNADTVDNYWYEMWNICMHTKLGLRQTVTGTYITIENLDHKPLMQQAMKAKTPEIAVVHDDGRVPGDKRGAAGFDSALWSHVKRNWIWGETSKKRVRPKNIKVEKHLKSLKPKTFSERKHPKNILRQVLPRKDIKKKGLKPEYDAVDRKLMVRLQQSRPEWVESEDKALQICKIVIMFIYRTAPRQFIPYTVIRDVLHKLSPISCNKTSGAVRRRLFNIFGVTEKQELFQQIAKTLDFIPYVKKYFYTIQQNEKQALGAFVFLTTYFFKHQNEMQYIFDLLSCKTPMPEMPISSEVLEITATDSYDNPRKATLYSKLSKNHPQTENDIILDTIQSIIHCSLAYQQNETGWLIQLFCVYRKYPQELLRRALDDLRANHLISGRRTVVRKTKNIEGFPIIAKFFQFSHYYCYTQITKYLPEVFVQTHEIFLSIWKNKDANLIPMEGFKQGHIVGLAELAAYIDTYFNVDIPKEVLVLNPNITDHTELIRELAVRYKKMLTLVKSGSYFNDADQVGNERVKYGCRWPMIHRFLRSWFLSDGEDLDAEDVFEDIHTSETGILPKMQPVLSQEEGKQLIDDLNPIRLAANDETTFEDYEKKLECFLSTNDVPETPELIIPDALTVDDTSILQNYLSTFKQKETHVTESINESVPEVPEKIDERIQYLMNDELTVEQIMKEMLSECPIEERKVPKPTNLARLLVLGLFPELDDDEERLERLYKHFLVICPETKFLMPDDFESNATMNYLRFKHVDVCKKLLRNVQRDAVISKTVPELEKALEKTKNMGGSDHDLYLVEKLVNFVHKKKSIGASIQQLKERFSGMENLNLAEVLKALSKLNLIMRIGITYTVYVHHEYRKPWLVESCLLGEQDRLKLMDTNPETLNSDLPSLSSLESYEEIKLSVKPWTQIDGSLNTEAFQKWMLTVLGHCLSDAVLPLSRLIELCAFLKPVDIYYLLECLKFLGCVRLITYKEEKCTLFNTLAYSEISDADITDDFQDIFIQCDSLALIKLGTLLNEKEQCYSFSLTELSKYESF